MLTLKQQLTYEFIERYILTNSRSPTLTEIGLAIGVRAKGTVHRYVQSLVDEGLIEIQVGKKRNIRLLDLPKTNFHIPLLGKIAAGQPIEAIEDEQVFNFGDLFLGKHRFALKVAGDSMIEEGILDGDIVICSRANTAREGDIVVALIDGNHATLKKIHFNPNDETIMLIPANTTMAPQVYAATRVTIQGVFVGLCRLGNYSL